MKAGAQVGFRLPCKATGSNLKWTWKHNGTAITAYEGRPFRLSDDGTLTGSGLIAKDSGTYQCFVGNAKTGAVAFSRKLKVAVTGKIKAQFRPRASAVSNPIAISFVFSTAETRCRFRRHASVPYSGFPEATSSSPRNFFREYNRPRIHQYHWWFSFVAAEARLNRVSCIHFLKEQFRVLVSGKSPSYKCLDTDSWLKSHTNIIQLWTHVRAPSHYPQNTLIHICIPP